MSRRQQRCLRDNLGPAKEIERFFVFLVDWYTIVRFQPRPTATTTTWSSAHGPTATTTQTEYEMFEQEYEMFEQDKILNRDELAKQESDIPLHDVKNKATRKDSQQYFNYITIPCTI
jgi:hypothetical protein